MLCNAKLGKQKKQTSCHPKTTIHTFLLKSMAIFVQGWKCHTFCEECMDLDDWGATILGFKGSHFRIWRSSSIIWVFFFIYFFCFIVCACAFTFLVSWLMLVQLWIVEFPLLVVIKGLNNYCMCQVMYMEH